MATTPNLAITLVEQSQSQKEVTVNAALHRVDALLNNGVKDKDLTTPPGGPSDGDLYIVPASATGDWAGQTNNLAYFNQVWKFIAPNEGILVWVSDEDQMYRFDGSSWGIAGAGENNTASNVGTSGEGVFKAKSGVDLQFRKLVAGSNVTISGGADDITITGGAGGGGGDLLSTNNLNDLSNVSTARSNLGLGTMATQNASSVTITGGSAQNASLLGVNTTADTTNKLSVKSAAVLFDHAGTNSQIKVNKNAISNTASYIFQTAFSGRAEFGLIGDDDFSLKVSPNGSTFYESFKVDRNSGNIFYKQEVNLEDNLLVRPEIKDYAETAQSVTSISSTTINLQNGNVINLTHNTNISTLSINNPPASGKAGSFTIIRTKDANATERSISWPASVKWAGGTAPTLTQTSSAIDVFSFISTNGGSTWYGFAGGLDMQ